MASKNQSKSCWSLFSPTEDEGGGDCSDQVSLYSMVELTWHLCEVLFIEVLPTGCLVQQLLEWVRWHSGRSTHCELCTVSVDWVYRALLNTDGSLKLFCIYSAQCVPLVLILFEVKFDSIAFNWVMIEKNHLKVLDSKILEAWLGFWQAVALSCRSVPYSCWNSFTVNCRLIVGCS